MLSYACDFSVGLKVFECPLCAGTSFVHGLSHLILRAAWEQGSCIRPIFQLRKQTQRQMPAQAKTHIKPAAPLSIHHYCEITKDNSKVCASRGNISALTFTLYYGVKDLELAWVCILAQVLHGCVLLAKSLNLSVLPFPFLFCKRG